MTLQDEISTLLREWIGNGPNRESANEMTKRILSLCGLPDAQVVRAGQAAVEAANE